MLVELDDGISAHLTFADWVGTKSPPLGRFLYGFGAGFSLDTESSGDTWFTAGKVLGFFVALCPFDALGEGLAAVRIGGRLPNAVKAAEVADRARGLPDDALVVRGGNEVSLSKEGLEEKIGTHPSGVTGWSAESKPGAGVEELAVWIKNNKVGVTTVGAIRGKGGDVVVTIGRSPNHVTITNISAEELSKLWEIRRNPVPKEGRR